MFDLVGNLAKSDGVPMPAFVDSQMAVAGFSSYRQLALAAGVDLVTMIYGLKGKRELSFKNACRIAKALKVTVNDLEENIDIFKA